MDGKTLYLLLITNALLFYMHPTLAVHRSAEIKGGLLFEKESDQPVLLNPKFALYHRIVNLNNIAQAADLMLQFSEQYDEFCLEISARSEQMVIDVPTYDLKSKFILINETVKTLDTPKVCRKYGYLPVEIRTFADIDQVKRVALPDKISTVYAGVYYDDKTNEVKYQSTHTATTETVQTYVYMYGNKTLSKSTRIVDMETRYQWATNNNNAVYDIYRRDYILVHTPNQFQPQKAICMRMQLLPYKQMQNNMTLFMLSHVCSRDKARIRQQALALIREVNLFQYHPDTLLNDAGYTVENEKLGSQSCDPTCYNCEILLKTIKNQALKYATLFEIPIEITQKYLQHLLLDEGKDHISFTDFLTTKDWKKFYTKANPFFLTMAQLDCELSNSDFDYQKYHNSIFIQLDDADHSIFVEKMKHYLHTKQSVEMKQKRSPLWMPIAHIPDFRHIQRMATENTKALQELNLHKDELAFSFNNLRREVLTLKNVTYQQDYAIMAAFAEKDTKDAKTELQNTVQIALLQLSNAMTDAMQQRTSPYVLSHNELQAIVIKESHNKLLLSSRLEEVLTTLHRNESTYYFQIAIPVIDDKAAFRLYHARPFPIFGPNHAQIKLQPDITFIGISADTTRYVALHAREYEECLKGHFCIVSGSPYSFNLQTSCTASSFRKNAFDCPSLAIEKANPFFVTYGNTTFYSVPDNYTVDTICPNANSNYRQKPVRGLTVMSGIGQLTINQNCFLKLPDDRIIEPHHMPDHSTSLGVSHITQALIYAPKSHDYHFNISQQNQFWSNWSETPELILPAWKNKAWEILNNVIDPKTLATQSVYSVTQILLILSITALCCCLFPNFYKWVKTVLLIRNPRKYWTDKGLFVPYWNRYTVNETPPANQRPMPFTAWWRRARNADTNASAPENNEALAHIFSQNEELIIPPPMTELTEIRVPSRYKTARRPLPPIPVPAPKLSSYMPAGRPEPEPLHDTSDITDAANDWRANSHIASLQLKAINAP